MAQKATKTLASRNSRTLNRTHLTTLGVHLLFWASYFAFSTPRNLYLYALLSAPSWLIELWLERIARPTYTDNGEVKRAGEDLEAQGLTEWMWDVLYWTWGCVGFAAALGEWVWWAWAIVPMYSAWCVWGVYTGARGMMGGMGGTGAAGQGGEGAGAGGGGQSKRQAKMEKRGGQKMVYR